jgi:hypothetical protein
MMRFLYFHHKGVTTTTLQTPLPINKHGTRRLTQFLYFVVVGCVCIVFLSLCVLCPSFCFCARLFVNLFSPPTTTSTTLLYSAYSLFVFGVALSSL